MLLQKGRIDSFASDFASIHDLHDFIEKSQPSPLPQESSSADE
jgi:hypothetical protein